MIQSPQLPLFDDTPVITPVTTGAMTHAEKFAAFHEANPQVYENLHRLAMQWRSRGKQHGAIAMFFELLRYQTGMRTTDPNNDGFLLNNNHRAYYARELMRREPALVDFFETRTKRGQPDDWREEE